MQSNDVIDEDMAEAIQFLMNIEGEKSRVERKAKEDKKFSKKMKEKQMKKEETKIDKAALKDFNKCRNWEECYAPWLKVDKEMRRSIEERAKLGMPEEMVKWYEQKGASPGWKRELGGGGALECPLCYLSFSLTLYLYLSLSHAHTLHLSIYLSIYLSIFLSIYLPIPPPPQQTFLTRLSTTASSTWASSTFSSRTRSERSSSPTFSPTTRTSPLSCTLPTTSRRDRGRGTTPTTTSTSCRDFSAGSSGAGGLRSGFVER